MRQPRAGRRASYREGAAFGALSFGSMTVIALASAVVTSRIYGVRVIGEYALVASTVALLRIFSTAKERPALVRELTAHAPRHPRVTGLFCATLAFSVGLTTVVSALALAAVYLLLSGPIGQPELFLPTVAAVVGYLVIANTGENFNPVFAGFRAGRELFWIRLHEGIGFLAIAVPLGIAFGTVWGLVAAMVGSQASALVHRVVAVRQFMRFSATRAVVRDGFRTLPDLVRFGLKIAPGTFADDASNESGTWIVGSLGSIAAVGAYGRALSLTKALLTFNTRITEMLFPTLVERRAKGDRPGFSRALVDSLRYATIGLLLPAAAVGGASDGVMSIFGPGFERGADALAVLLLVPPLASVSQMQRLALYSIDRPWLASIAGLLRLVATVAGGAVLIWQLGATGAALALVLGFFVDLGYSTRIVARHLASPLRRLWPPSEWLAVLAAYVTGFVAARVVDAALPFLLGVLAGGAAGTLAYVAVLVVGGGVNERDRDRLRDARASVARRLRRNEAVTASRGM